MHPEIRFSDDFWESSKLLDSLEFANYLKQNLVSNNVYQQFNEGKAAIVLRYLGKQWPRSRVQ